MKSEPSSETALAVRDARLELWRDPEWQRLWLAVVPASEGAPADFTLRVAVTLARTGMVHLGSPVQVADGTKVPLAYLTQFMEEVQRCTRDGERILVAVAPMTKNPITLSIAQATDAALLCVLLDHMTSSRSKKTVAEIGFNRFVGSVIFRGDDLNISAGR